MQPAEQVDNHGCRFLLSTTLTNLNCSRMDDTPSTTKNRRTGMCRLFDRSESGHGSDEQVTCAMGERTL